MRANGYELEHDGRLITVFSAPNYCDQQGNKAAIVKIESDLTPQFITFAHVEHPPMKPMAYSNMVRASLRFLCCAGCVADLASEGLGCEEVYVLDVFLNKNCYGLRRRAFGGLGASHGIWA